MKTSKLRAVPSIDNSKPIHIRVSFTKGIPETAPEPYQLPWWKRALYHGCVFGCSNLLWRRLSVKTMVLECDQCGHQSLVDVSSECATQTEA